MDGRRVADGEVGRKGVRKILWGDGIARDRWFADAGIGGRRIWTGIGGGG
jgi:hypothetical protein